MEIEEVIKKIERNTVEIITREELKQLLMTEKNPRGYIGVEPSGLFHIGWIVWVKKLKDLMDIGVKMHLLEATWHAQINDKLEGDIERIRMCGKYFEYALKALGVDTDKLIFVTADEFMDTLDYWSMVFKVSKSLTLARVKRAMTIMGRKASEAELDFSKMLYPSLQVTDIFYGEFKICLGGTDQRRAHILAREVAEKINVGWKPIAIHTPLIPGLAGLQRMNPEDIAKMDTMEISIEAKMSKSKPGDAIFIHDTPDEIRKKIRNAYCPPKTLEHNPIIAINKYILFDEQFVLHIDRPEKYGGPIDITSFDDLAKLYTTGKLHPLDLKIATAEALIKFLEPARKMFETDKKAREYLEAVKQARVTR